MDIARSWLALGLMAALLLRSSAAAGEESAAKADPVPDDIDTIFVTASQQPLTLLAIPGSVDVIDREEIEASRFPTVLELLRRRPGLHLEQGAAGSRASLFTRGLEANYTLVMIDGVVMNDPSNARGGSFDFSTLGVENIERIEVVRGPVSAVHGSAAMAGAVNIVTRGGRGPDSIGLDVEGGRYGYVRSSLDARGERGPVDLALVGTYLDEGDFDDSVSKGGTLLTSLGARLGERTDLRGTLRFADFDEAAFPDASGGTEFAVRRANEERKIGELNGGIVLEHRAYDWLEAALTVDGFHRTEQRRSPGVAPAPGDPASEVPAEPDSQERSDRVRSLARATGSGPHGLSLTLGGDFYWERGQNEGTLLLSSVPFPLPRAFDLDRFVGGLFAELHWESAFGLVALASLRVDFPDDEDAQVSPRVGGSYVVPKLGIELVGSWGEGFKLPSLFALGHPIVGDPGLRPERTCGWDLGARRRFLDERVEFAVTGFDIDVMDLIDFDPASNRLVNVSLANSTGVELELELWPHETLSLRGYATYANARNLVSDTRLRNRPEWRGGFGIEWTPTLGLRAGLEALFVGNVIDYSNPTGTVTLDAWERFDLVVAWQPRDWLELTLAIDNLFDANYQEVVGFPALGIRPRAGLRIRLP